MFTTVLLNLKYKTFIIQIATLSADLGDKLHPLKKAQITHLKADEALIEVFSKYIDFADIFLSRLAIELLEYTRINNHAIELIDDWQLFYGFIYSFGLLELEILKIYIENNLANNFIWPFKSSARALIFFDKKPNKSLWLYIDYQGFNNLIRKNCYLISLIRLLFNWLGWA